MHTPDGAPVQIHWIPRMQKQCVMWTQFTSHRKYVAVIIKNYYTNRKFGCQNRFKI